VWKLHRLLKSIISGKGPKFVAELIQKLNQMLEIESKILMVFHPQTDKQIERVN